MKRPALQNNISGSEFYEWLLGPEKVSGFSRKGILIVAIQIHDKVNLM